VTFHKLLRQAGGHGHAKDNFSYVLMCEVGEALADMNRANGQLDPRCSMQTYRRRWPI